MKKVILFDTFSFVGYGLCCRMLDEGISVIGVDAQPIDNSPEEDKMLRIGRNANFHFMECPNAMLKTSLFEQTDSVIFPWFCPTHQIRNEEREERLLSIINSCNDTKTKLILVSARQVDSDTVNTEIEDDWYSKMNMDIDNSLYGHQKVRTNNVELLFTFIDFSNKNLQEGILKKDDHKEWILQNLYS